jgi:hypothetical protein
MPRRTYDARRGRGRKHLSYQRIDIDRLLIELRRRGFDRTPTTPQPAQERAA